MSHSEETLTEFVFVEFEPVFSLLSLTSTSNEQGSGVAVGSGDGAGVIEGVAVGVGVGVGNIAAVARELPFMNTIFDVKTA